MVEIHADREETTMWEEVAISVMEVHKRDLYSKLARICMEAQEVSDLQISIEAISHNNKVPSWINLLINKLQEDMEDHNKEQL